MLIKVHLSNMSNYINNYYYYCYSTSWLVSLETTWSTTLLFSKRSAFSGTGPMGHMVITWFLMWYNKNYMVIYYVVYWWISSLLPTTPNFDQSSDTDKTPNKWHVPIPDSDGSPTKLYISFNAHSLQETLRVNTIMTEMAKQCKQISYPGKWYIFGVMLSKNNLFANCGMSLRVSGIEQHLK